jgi:hypothetical protein
LFCLSVVVLATLCVSGAAVSVKMAFFVLLSTKVMSGRLKGIVLLFYYYCYYYHYCVSHKVVFKRNIIPIRPV